MLISSRSATWSEVLPFLIDKSGLFNWYFQKRKVSVPIHQVSASIERKMKGLNLVELLTPFQHKIFLSEVPALKQGLVQRILKAQGKLWCEPFQL